MDHDTCFSWKIYVPSLLHHILFRTTSARAGLLGEMGDIEMCGDSARGEMLLLRGMDQGPPEEGWVVRHRRRE